MNKYVVTYNRGEVIVKADNILEAYTKAEEAILMDMIPDLIYTIKEKVNEA